MPVGAKVKGAASFRAPRTRTCSLSLWALPVFVGSGAATDCFNVGVGVGYTGGTGWPQARGRPTSGLWVEDHTPVCQHDTNGWRQFFSVPNQCFPKSIAVQPSGSLFLTPLALFCLFVDLVGGGNRLQSWRWDRGQLKQQSNGEARALWLSYLELFLNILRILRLPPSPEQLFGLFLFSQDVYFSQYFSTQYDYLMCCGWISASLVGVFGRVLSIVNPSLTFPHTWKNEFTFSFSLMLSGNLGTLS